MQEEGLQQDYSLSNEISKEPDFQKHIKQLWAISSDIEAKLDPVMYPVGPQADEAEMSTRLESELKRLVSRYTDILQRISV